jgi:hypothetical protein
VTERDLITLSRTLGTVVMLSYLLYGGVFRRRRYNQILAEEVAKSHQRELYLAGMLDKYGIEVDEFDLIALRNL